MSKVKQTTGSETAPPAVPEETPEERAAAAAIANDEAATAAFKACEAMISALRAQYRATIRALPVNQRDALELRELDYDTAGPDRKRAEAFAWFVTFFGAVPAYAGMKNLKGRASYLASQGLTPCTVSRDDLMEVSLISEGKVRKDPLFKAGVELARMRASGSTEYNHSVDAIASTVGALIMTVARAARSSGAKSTLVKVTDAMIERAIIEG